MKLSDNFTLEEATFSQTAIRKGIKNEPDTVTIARMKIAANGMEKVRRLLQCPIIVSSWYRSPKLNTAIGGAKNSDHKLGYAVDFKTHKHSIDVIFNAIKNSDIEYDQLINEYGRWIHISFSPRKRRMAFRIG